MSVPAYYCITLVEVPIIEGKLDEAFKVFTEHAMGLAYTSSRPGFLSLDVALDAEKNSVILFERWVKKDDWTAYMATRAVDNAANTSWNETFGPLVSGAPRMVAMDCLENYAGSVVLAKGAIYGVTLVEVPIIEGKLDEAFKVFTEHAMGLAYTSSRPGFLNLDIALDAEKNSVILFERWEKKADWTAYMATRAVDNAANTSWNENFGPLVSGAPRMVAMDCLKTYSAM